jgi:hypothetical protein
MRARFRSISFTIPCAWATGLGRITATDKIRISFPMFSGRMPPLAEITDSSKVSELILAARKTLHTAQVPLGVRPPDDLSQLPHPP